MIFLTDVFVSDTIKQYTINNTQYTKHKSQIIEKKKYLDYLLQRGDIVRRNLLKLPLYLFLAGLLMRGITRIAVWGIMKISTERAFQMDVQMLYVQLIVSVILFIIIGIRISKIYSTKICFMSASIVVVYSIVTLLIEQLSQHYGLFDMTQLSYYMYIPLEIFIIITSVLVRLSRSDSINWLYAIPAILAPYLFLLFTRERQGVQIKES